MPLGVLDFNGRPFGLGIIAQAGREDLMFQFMSAFERHFPPRPVPSRLFAEGGDEAHGGNDEAEPAAAETSKM